MSEYHAIGVQGFSSKLLLELTWRIQDFTVYVMRQQKTHPEISHVKSKEEWVQEYIKWAKKQP